MEIQTNILNSLLQEMRFIKKQNATILKNQEKFLEEDNFVVREEYLRELNNRQKEDYLGEQESRDFYEKLRKKAENV
jgi:hypothetical protein